MQMQVPSKVESRSIYLADSLVKPVVKVQVQSGTPVSGVVDGPQANVYSRLFDIDTKFEDPYSTMNVYTPERSLYIRCILS